MKSAKRTMEIKEYNVAEIAAYLAAFHATRALLYAKGYKERSHVCLGIAVRELYDDEAIREHMITFDRIREMRHEIQYLGREPSKEECEFAFSFASELIDLVKKALNISETSSGTLPSRILLITLSGILLRPPTVLTALIFLCLSQF